MRFLAIGDPHFKVNNQDETDIMCREIDTIIDEVAPDVVVVLGDTLDRHDTVKTQVQERAVDWLASIKNKVTLVLLIGNHDLKSNDQFFSTQHPFTALKEWDNTIVVDRAIRIDDIIFCPYVPPGRFHEALSYVEDYRSAKLIFAHQEFRGVSIDNFISTVGDQWDEDEPPVVSGHIHQQSCPSSNILYTGTPIQQSYAECPNKMIWIVTVNDDGFSTKERYLETTIKKRTITLTIDDLEEYIPDKKSNEKVKAKIVCSDDERVMLNKNLTISSMKKLGYEITYQIVPRGVDRSEFTNVIVKMRSWNDIMLSKLSSRPHLAQLYSDIMRD